MLLWLVPLSFDPIARPRLTSYDFENEVDAAALVEASELFPSVDPESDELHPILKSCVCPTTVPKLRVVRRSLQRML